MSNDTIIIGLGVLAFAAWAAGLIFYARTFLKLIRGERPK